MNTKHWGKRLTGRLALITALVGAVFVAAAVLPQTMSYAAGMQTQGGQQGGDQIRDQLRLRDGSCMDSLISKVLEGDQDRDQLRLRDGSCSDCDGEPDQDRVRDRDGQQ